MEVQEPSIREYVAAPSAMARGGSVRKTHCLGCRGEISETKWLHRQTCISHTLLEARKAKIRVLADLVPGERPLLGVQTSRVPTWHKGPHDLI